MGANTNWKVHVIKTINDVLDISAVTSGEAEKEAMKMDGVIAVTFTVHEDKEDECKK